MIVHIGISDLLFDTPVRDAAPIDVVLPWLLADFPVQHDRSRR